MHESKRVDVYVKTSSVLCIFQINVETTSNWNAGIIFHQHACMVCKAGLIVQILELNKTSVVNATAETSVIEESRPNIL